MSSGLFAGRAVMWMNFSEPMDIKGRGQHCCAAMDTALTYTCSQHENPFDCGDQLLCFDDLFEEYGLIIHDGGSTYVCITHCPWCGTRLPESRRDAYFDELERLGLAIWRDDLPERYRRPGWWVAADTDTSPPTAPQRDE